MSTWSREIHLSIRALAGRPGFAAIAVLTLALGVGANVAIFSLVNALFVKPLPFPEAERVVLVWADEPSPPVDCHRLPPSPRDLREWMQQRDVFENLAGTRGRAMTLDVSGEAERINGVEATADLFPILGVEPVLGRVFTASEDRPGAQPVIIISYGLWQRRFGGDPSVVGRSVRFDGQDRRVVGVMPRAFRFPADAGMPAIYSIGNRVDFWSPLRYSSEDWARSGNRNLIPVGRLMAGVSLQTAQVAMSALAQRQAQAHPETNKDASIHVESLRHQMASGVRPVLVLLWAAVALVLLVACANVAGLLASRWAARSQEIAIRSALGARPGRIMRQVLIEAGLLAAAGCAVSLPLGRWLVAGLSTVIPRDVPRLDQAGFDVTTVTFAALLSVVASLLCGTAPAFWAARSSATADLRGAQRQVGRSMARVHRELFSTGQIALATMLTFGALLLVRSYSNLTSVDPGFQPEGAVALDMWMPGLPFSEWAAGVERVRDGAGRLPGIVSAGAITSLPLEGRGAAALDPFVVEGELPLPQGERPVAAVPGATPGYFRTMGIPLLRGRDFDAQDHRNGRPVAIVNKALARRFFRDGDALGRRLKLGRSGDSDTPWMTVVGVVGDVRNESLAKDAMPHIYLPYAQRPMATISLVVRTVRRANDLAPELRRALRSSESSLAISKIRSVASVKAQSVASQRFQTLVMGLFAGMAVFLTALGLYGVVTSWASQRTREIGVRMALGARAGNILVLVLGRGLALALGGVALGMVGALSASKLVESLLYGVIATDPASCVAVALFILAVALAAGYLPARHAVALDPSTAMRHES